MYKSARLVLNQKERRDYTHVCDQKYMTDSRLTNAHAWLGRKKREVLLSIQFAYICMTKKTKKTVGLQMRMLGLLGEKAGGGVREEGAAPRPQSSMSIAILTCIAIN